VRKSFAVLFLAVGALVGYSLHAVPLKAQAQASNWFAFNIGETVKLSADLPQSEITCKVTRVENGFIVRLPRPVRHSCLMERTNRSAGEAIPVTKLYYFDMRPARELYSFRSRRKFSTAILKRYRDKSRRCT